MAGRYRFTDPDLLIATARQESGLNPLAVGDQGQSYGVFQEHSRGRGAGIPVASRQDVAAATERAIREFTAIRAKNPSVDRGTWAALAQRPLDAQGYARSVNALLGRTPGASPTPAAPAAASGPAWWQAVSDRAPGPAGPKGGAAGTGPAVFPVAGYTGKVEFHHGHQEAVGGSDLFAPEGTPVLAMVPGSVQWASHDPLGGHNVGVLGDDGRTYYYAHFANAPKVKVGQRVDAGQQIGDVGRSGNAASTPSHLHIGIGQGIQTGAGAQGGLGRGFDAVSYLRQTLTGATPAAPDAPGVGQLTSTSSGPAPAWWSAVARR